MAGVVYPFHVLPFGLSTTPREFTKTLTPVVQLLRTQGVRVQFLLGRLNYACEFSGTCTINFSTSSVFGLNDQLKHVNVTTLTHSGLLVLNFNLEQALFLPWTLSYQFSPLSYPVCLHQRSCLLAKFHPSAGCHICPVLTQ